MSYQYFDCKVIDIIDESDKTKRFFIQYPNDISFSFSAGQFVMIDLPIESKITNRSYSIASAPDKSNIIELAIVLNPTGVATPYLFDFVKNGSDIKCTKALGKFSLPEKIDTDLCFICTGTGVAPLRSMTHYIFNNQVPHQNIYMIFGNRWEKDILYRTELEKLNVTHPEFKFIPVLSRDNPDWKGKKGYVHQVYEELFSDRRSAYFYICGWHEMIKEARGRLEAMGYERKFIKFEQFD